MKWMEKVVGAVCVALVAACSSASSGPSAGGAAPATPTAIERVEPTVGERAEPTVGDVVVVELSDEEQVRAALAAFEAAPDPAGLVAWDVLESEVIGEQVTVRLCVWDGETVFDEVRVVRYLVRADERGEPATEQLFSNVTTGDCLNTELIRSALAATRDHDTYWGAVLEEPGAYDVAEAQHIFSAPLAEQYAQTVSEWIADDLYWRGHGLDGRLPTSAIGEVLWRRFDTGGEGVFEVLACRKQPREYGLYRHGQLIDDYKADGVFGQHSIDRYFLAREGGTWQIRGLAGNLWSDCEDFQPDWITGVNEWLPEPKSWAVLPDA